MRLFYSSIFFLLLPVVLLRLWWRGRKLPAYRKRIGERFAIFTSPLFNRPRVWVHTASVGEFIAFQPIIDEIIAFNSHDIVVTTMTPTGSERVNASYGDRVFHVYTPYDIGFLVNKFLKKIQPELAIFVETELWPNTIHACKKNGVITMLANGRLSEKSARGYAKISAISRPMLSALSCSAIQNNEDAERFKSLGLNPNTCLITGSIKFDIAVSRQIQESARFLRDQIDSAVARKVFIAGSTHKGEDAVILAAFKTIKEQAPNSMLILVPRHPDRFDVVAKLCEDQGFSVLRRSSQLAPTARTDIMLGDTMGELLLLYGCADVAFIGGSLIENGGHNYLEAAIWGIPIISGPSVFNFAQISDMLIDCNAMFIADSAELISTEVLKLFSNENLAKRKGAAAANVVIQNRGAKAKLVALIKGVLNTDGQ